MQGFFHVGLETPKYPEVVDLLAFAESASMPTKERNKRTFGRFFAWRGAYYALMVRSLTAKLARLDHRRLALIRWRKRM